MPDNHEAEETDEWAPERAAALDKWVSRVCDLIAELPDDDMVHDIVCDTFCGTAPEVLTQFHTYEREASSFTFGLPIFGPDAYDMEKVAEDPLHHGADTEWCFRLGKAYLLADEAGKELFHLATLAVLRRMREEPPHGG